MEFHPHVTIETRLDPELKHILGSPVHISKTIMNLVSNAAEAITKDGMIHIQTINQYLGGYTYEDENIAEGEFVILRISDTGVGMTPQEQEKIFEPFFTKKVMGRSGTGLGMAVVMMVAE